MQCSARKSRGPSEFRAALFVRSSRSETMESILLALAISVLIALIAEPIAAMVPNDHCDSQLNRKVSYNDHIMADHNKLKGLHFR